MIRVETSEEREERLAALLRLRERVDEEIVRLQAAARRKVRSRRSRHEKPPCGTEQGYQWHRSRDQAADDACKLAHRLHNRVGPTRLRSAS